MAAMASRSDVKTRALPVLRYTPSSSTTVGSMAVDLMTEPCGARFPPGKVTVLVRPLDFGAVGGHDDVVGVDAVDVSEVVAHVLSALGIFPPVEVFVEGLPGGGKGRGVEKTEVSEVEHYFGDTTGGVELSGGMSDGTVGEDIYDARYIVVDTSPVVDVHAVTSSGMGDCGCVQ